MGNCVRELEKTDESGEAKWESYATQRNATQRNATQRNATLRAYYAQIKKTGKSRIILTLSADRKMQILSWVFCAGL